METKDTYFSVERRGEGLFKDNGSRFIAFALPVETEEEIKEAVNSFRKEYHDARHHCYAWRLGADGARFRANDDGEPSGSAGKQILGGIDAEGLSDTLVVVVRYFGGIKLGIPGLIRAYRSATRDALADAGRTEKIAGNYWRLEFGYEMLPQVMKLLKNLDLKQENAVFGEMCSLRTRVRLSREEAFSGAAADLPGCIFEKEV